MRSVLFDESRPCPTDARFFLAQLSEGRTVAKLNTVRDAKRSSAPSAPSTSTSEPPRDRAADNRVDTTLQDVFQVRCPAYEHADDPAPQPFLPHDRQESRVASRVLPIGDAEGAHALSICS